MVSIIFFSSFICVLIETFRPPSQSIWSNQSSWCSRRTHWARSVTFWPKICSDTRWTSRDWPDFHRKFSHNLKGAQNSDDKITYQPQSFSLVHIHVSIFSNLLIIRLSLSGQAETKLSLRGGATAACRERTRRNKTTTWYAQLHSNLHTHLICPKILHLLLFCWWACSSYNFQDKFAQKSMQQRLMLLWTNIGRRKHK